MKKTSISLPSSSGVLINAQGCVTYWSVLDLTSSSSSVFSLWDGQNASGQNLGVFSTVSGQSTSEYIRKLHLPFEKALYYDLESGDLRGSVTVWVCESNDEWQQIERTFLALP